MELSNKKIIDYINKIKPPYNVNQLSEKKVLSELKNIQSVKKNINSFWMGENYATDCFG